jgi:hypothetical protein
VPVIAAARRLTSFRSRPVAVIRVTVSTMTALQRISAAQPIALEQRPSIMHRSLKFAVVVIVAALATNEKPGIPIVSIVALHRSCT